MQKNRRAAREDGLRFERVGGGRAWIDAGRDRSFRAIEFGGRAAGPFFRVYLRRGTPCRSPPLPLASLLEIEGRGRGGRSRPGQPKGRRSGAQREARDGGPAFGTAAKMAKSCSGATRPDDAGRSGHTTEDSGGDVLAEIMASLGRGGSAQAPDR